MSIVLNRNEGLDVLHPDGKEQCNLDDSDGRQTVDLETARALVVLGQATVCHHCDDGSLSETETASGPTYTEDTPTLNTRSDLP